MKKVLLTSVVNVFIYALTSCQSDYNPTSINNHINESIRTDESANFDIDSLNSIALKAQLIDYFKSLMTGRIDDLISYTHPNVILTFAKKYFPLSSDPVREYKSMIISNYDFNQKEIDTTQLKFSTRFYEIKGGVKYNGDVICVISFGIDISYKGSIKNGSDDSIIAIRQKGKNKWLFIATDPETISDVLTSTYPSSVNEKIYNLIRG